MRGRLAWRRMPVALQAAVWGAAAALVLSVYVEVTGAWDLALTDRVSKDVLVFTLGAALAALLWRGPLNSSRPAVRLPAALAYLFTVWPATALMLVMIEIAAAVAAGLPVFGFLFTAPVNLLFILALDAAWLTWPLGVLAAWSLTRRPA